MPTKIQISVSFDIADDSRTQTRTMASIDPAIVALEDKIKEVTGMAVTVDMRPVRHKAVAGKPAEPSTPPHRHTDRGSAA
ncbi:MAG TPA: hypothetical protein VIJ52_08210 [Pseudolabrys sp.]